MAKKALHFPEIQRFAVVSTVHITEEDSQILTQAGNRNFWPYNYRYPIVFNYEYGWFVHVPEPGDIEDALENYKKAELSDAFIRLIRECSEQSIHFLRLDGDGPQVQGAKRFEW